jgi:hypothetical protein
MAIIAIDFDHCLVEGDQPRPGAREAINALREAGHKVIINSCNGPAWIRQVLDNNDMRYDYIWGSKPGDSSKVLADCYIDDKAYRFEGNWELATSEVLGLVGTLDNRKW